MTEKEMLLKMIEQGKTMRNFQKAYFNSKDPQAKRIALMGSKQNEREFDNLIHNIEQLIKPTT